MGRWFVVGGCWNEYREAMTKDEKVRFDRIELVMFGDPQSNIIGLVEYQKGDNEKWSELQEILRSNRDILQKIQEQNQQHYEMTLSQEERLKKIEIVFYAFGQLSRIKKRTLVVLGGAVTFLSGLAAWKEEIGAVVERIFHR